MKTASLFTIMVLPVVMAGCTLSTDIRDDDVYRPLLTSKPAAEQASANSYVRLMTPEARTLNKKVTINAKVISVMDAITDALPDLNVVPLDLNVDMRKEVAVYANSMPVTDYLEMLSGLTDYHFEVRGATIYASSIRNGQWNLAALTSKREAVSSVGKSNLGSASISSAAEGSQAGGESSESSITIRNDDDAWDQVLQGARAILGVTQDQSMTDPASVDSTGGMGSVGQASSSTSFPGLTDPFTQTGLRAVQPYVTGVRRFGTLSASGSPSRMKVLDKWIQGLTHNAQKQVRLDIRAFDVSLTDQRGRGIDWTALYQGSDGTGALLSGVAPVAITGAGAWSIAGNGTSGDKWSFDALFNFLGNYGEVNIMNQPSLTVVNGSTAMIANGDMFSFISSVERTLEGDGVSTVTPVISQMRVGLSLSVTPRVLDDDRILIEVVPIISSVQGYQDFKIGDWEFQTPNIALQELSTHVIARSGETVQLGGLITRKLTEQMSRIPFADGDGGFANFLFSSVRNELERKELVLSITPMLLDV